MLFLTKIILLSVCVSCTPTGVWNSKSFWWKNVYPFSLTQCCLPSLYLHTDVCESVDECGRKEILSSDFQWMRFIQHAHVILLYTFMHWVGLRCCIVLFQVFYRKGINAVDTRWTLLCFLCKHGSCFEKMW